MRTCAEPGCDTILSRYNALPVCSFHAGAPGPLKVSPKAVELMADLIMPWRARAACTDSNVPMRWFFGEEHSRTGESATKLRKARQVCADCPVKLPCASYALAHDVRGVWVGSTRRQRRRYLPGQELELLEDVRVASLTGPYRALNHAGEWAVA